MEVEQKRHESIRKRLRERISHRAMKILNLVGTVWECIKYTRDSEDSGTEATLKDKASAAITGAILIIIFVLFIVAAVKLGLTFSSIYRDVKLFFFGS